MRAFIAIELSDTVRKEVAALSERLRASRARASWVRPENLHLTLRFLGEVNEASVETMGRRLAKAYEAFEPFALRVAGVGAFPDIRRPGVVWAGVGPREGPLAKTQEIADEAARELGVRRDKKPFHPHLTLARIRDPRETGALARAIEAEGNFEGGAFTAGGVALFRSELTKKGPVYTRLKEFAFRCRQNHPNK